MDRYYDNYQDGPKRPPMDSNPSGGVEKKGFLRRGREPLAHPDMPNSFLGRRHEDMTLDGKKHWNPDNQPMPRELNKPEHQNPDMFMDEREKGEERWGKEKERWRKHEGRWGKHKGRWAKDKRRWRKHKKIWGKHKGRWRKHKGMWGKHKKLWGKHKGRWGKGKGRWGRFKDWFRGYRNENYWYDNKYK